MNIKKIARAFVVKQLPNYFFLIQKIYQKTKFMKMIFSMKIYSHNSRPYYALWPVSKLKDDTSQFGQSTLIDILLAQKQSGIFVDIGANDPVFNSNSYFHEKNRAWSGFSFEPLDSYKSIWLAQRPNTVFQSCAIGKTRESLFLNVTTGQEGWEDQLSSIQSVAKGENSQQVSVYPLSDFEIPNQVDFLSIDVEGYEHAVLDGVNWKNFNAKIICIENCLKTLGDQTIRDRLEKLGYFFFARIKYIDDIYVSAEMKNCLVHSNIKELMDQYFQVFQIRNISNH